MTASYQKKVVVLLVKRKKQFSKKSKHLLIKYLPNNDIECNLHEININLHYKIYDVSAKEILNGTSFNNKIVLKQNDFKPGIYILTVIKNNDYFAEKIQIK